MLTCTFSEFCLCFQHCRLIGLSWLANGWKQCLDTQQRRKLFSVHSSLGVHSTEQSVCVYTQRQSNQTHSKRCYAETLIDVGLRVFQVKDTNEAINGIRGKRIGSLHYNSRLFWRSEIVCKQSKWLDEDWDKTTMCSGSVTIRTQWCSRYHM